MAIKLNKQSINHKEITYVWPPPKPVRFLHELIPQIPLFGITEFNSYLSLKHFKIVDVVKIVRRR